MACWVKYRGAYRLPRPIEVHGHDDVGVIGYANGADDAGAGGAVQVDGDLGGVHCAQDVAEVLTVEGNRHLLRLAFDDRGHALGRVANVGHGAHLDRAGAARRAVLITAGDRLAAVLGVAIRWSLDVVLWRRRSK